MGTRWMAVLSVVLLLGSGCGDDSTYDCTYCGDVCVYTDFDPENCGSCGNVCPAAQICESTRCVCPDDGELCGDACVDTMTDPGNCGGCGTVCAPGSGCTDGVCDEELVEYGTVDVDFTSGYIYDGPMWSMDLDYRWEHFTDGVVREPVVSGTFADGLSIPDTDTESSITHAEHWVSAGGNPAFVRVAQESFQDAAWTVVSNPSVRIDFADDAIEAGTYQVDLAVESGHVGLYVYDVLNLESGEVCILAVGIGGSIQVTEATDTTSIEGGALSFDGSAIPIYHPSSTPEGDLRDAITAMDLTVCPMR